MGCQNSKEDKNFFPEKSFWKILKKKLWLPKCVVPAHPTFAPCKVFPRKKMLVSTTDQKKKYNTLSLNS